MALLAAAFALVLSALHVYFRDVRFIVTAALTVWLYVTPVIFQVDQLPHFMRGIIRAQPDDRRRRVVPLRDRRRAIGLD